MEPNPTFHSTFWSNYLHFSPSPAYLLKALFTWIDGFVGEEEDGFE